MVGVVAAAVVVAVGVVRVVWMVGWRCLGGRRRAVDGAGPGRCDSSARATTEMGWAFFF
jgi:hypothetical protein